MRAILIIMMSAVMALPLSAQGPQEQQGAFRQFDPAKFQVMMESYITKEAALTPQEASNFFPIYREYQSKQRSIFGQARRLRKIKPTDEKGCREAITKLDELDIQIKELQQQYRKKYLKVLPASKVYDIITAEEKFHRMCMDNASKKMGWKQPPFHQHKNNK